MFGIRSRKIISLLIIDAKCTGCGTCIDKCRRNVISLAEEGGYKLGLGGTSGECTGCGRCQRYCPEDAIRLMTKKIVD